MERLARPFLWLCPVTSLCWGPPAPEELELSWERGCKTGTMIFIFGKLSAASQHPRSLRARPGADMPPPCGGAEGSRKG